MIRMDMRIEDRDKRESEFAEESYITIDLIMHWVDDDSLSTRSITDDIGVCRALRIEELTKYERKIHKNLVKITGAKFIGNLDDI